LIEQRAGANRRQKQEMLAALSNGEALILLRQGRREKALELEKEALQVLALCGGNLQQRILLTIHIGDLFFHAFRQIETAIAYYEDAQKLALSGEQLDSQFYIAPKLARAYARANEHKKVIHLLEAILQAYKLRNLDRTEKRESSYLALLLLLAHSYLHINSPSQATSHYLECFVRPNGIAPAALRGIASNLRHCAPSKDSHFWAWISSVIEEQERHFADSMQIRDLLTSI
jgi:tetratricopeptide (TPR) repeat protein